MSGYVNITVSAAFGGATGIASIPSSTALGMLSTAGSVNAEILSVLESINDELINGSADFQSYDIVAGQNLVIAGTGSTSFEQITNIDPTGGSSSPAAGGYTATVTAGVTTMLVQLPGKLTLAGAAATTELIVGALSDVDYTVTDAAAGTIYLTGGSDSVTLYNSSGTTAETIDAAGNDSINLLGQGTASVNVYDGDAEITLHDVDSSVVASGGATVNLFWDNASADGSLYFINNSSVAASVHIANFNGETAANHVTAYGGAGGGYFVGGAGGNNSLVGGTGVVTLIGAGSGDMLEANASAGTNVLVQGVGSETMLASSTTGSNIFSAGLSYPGLDEPSVTGVISTQGSGTQSFFVGNVQAGESIYGSTQSGASNAYFLVNNATAGGGQINIYNFFDANSVIYLTNGAGGAGNASITTMQADSVTGAYDISLSDGTNIVLQGLTADEENAIHTVSAFGITAIVG